MTIEEQLTESEERIVAAARTGQLVDLRVGVTTLDDPAGGMEWGVGRSVRAELLIELLTKDHAPEISRPQAVRIQGARITGALNLRMRTLICPLVLQDCYIDQSVDLNEASAAAICLPGCHILGLYAIQLRTTGVLDLGDGFTARWGVSLIGAHIGGPFILSGAHLSSLSEVALFADQLTVDQSMLCRNGFTTEGEIRLPGAHIGGQLDLSGAHLNNPGGAALAAEIITVEKGILAWNGLVAKGEVRLHSARIGGSLHLDGAHLTKVGGAALVADELTVDQSLFCIDGFTADGEVRLSGAHIGGRLFLSGAHLNNPGGRALGAEMINVEKGILGQDQFTADGEVRLVGARVEGPIDLSGAHLNNPGGRALDAETLTVAHNVFCREGFTADGEVRLQGAHIGGQLDLSEARLHNPGGQALSAEGISASRHVFCRHLATDGEVRLAGAHIGGQLDLGSAHLNNPRGCALEAQGITVDWNLFCGDGFSAYGEVSLVGATVRSHLYLLGASLDNSEGMALDLTTATADHLTLRPSQQPKGAVDLTNARVRVFDDYQATWPTRLFMRGFTYETLENDQIGVRERLRWLTLHPYGYTPQIYDQLATAYRRAGSLDAARKVEIAKQWKRRRVGNPFNWLLYLTVGYGYRTWLAAVWLVALTALGTRVFTLAEAGHLMHARPDAPAFRPLAYTLDVLLPIVDLGQQKAWIPQNWAQDWSWVLIAAGWYLTTAAVAGLTGVFKRD